MEAMRQSWTDERLDEFGKRMDERFDHVEEKFDERFDRVEERFKDADRRQGELIQENSRRFDEVDWRGGENSRRFDKMDRRFEAMHELMIRRFDSLQYSLLYAILAVFGAMTAGFIAVLVTQL